MMYNESNYEYDLPPLSNEDRDFLLYLIDNPPEPNERLRRAAEYYKEWLKRNRTTS